MPRVQKVLSAVGAARHVVAHGSIPDKASDSAKVAVNVAAVKRHDTTLKVLLTVASNMAVCIATIIMGLREHGDDALKKLLDERT